MLDRFRDWKDRRAKEHVREEATVVSCRQFNRWKRNALIAYIAVAFALGANIAIDRERAGDARAALVNSGRIVSVDGCNRDFRLYQKVRAVFLRSLDAITQQRNSGLITQAQYLRAKNFYETELSNFALPDCRITENLLTADPAKADQPTPQPLYHGSPAENEIGFDPKPSEGSARPIPPHG